jgi:pimeloyl-ACP methyl ester carboxylesterase
MLDVVLPPTKEHAMGDGRAKVVLVHGAWTGGWMWDRVVPLLVERGIESAAVDLPSCGREAQARTGLDGDVAAVRAVLDRVDGEIVLCGHSYGGMVITGAAAGHDRVRRLVYLCAFMPAEDESLLGMFGGAVPSFWRIRDDLSVLPEVDASPAPGELDLETAVKVARRRVPQSLLAYTPPPGGIAWRTTPSTYVVCTNDESLPPAFQRMCAARASTILELPTGHQPMLTRPELVADLLAGQAEDAG